MGATWVETGLLAQPQLIARWPTRPLAHPPCQFGLLARCPHMKLIQSRPVILVYTRPSPAHVVNSQHD